MKLQVTIELAEEDTLADSIDEALRELIREEVQRLLTELDIIQNPKIDPSF